jgi:hypothetical protein
VSGDDGSFTVGGLDDRAYDVRVKASGYAASEPREIRAGDPQRSPLVVSLVEGHDLRGRILDESGHPYGDVEVTLRSAEARLSDRAETAADGTFVFDGLPPGKVTLSSFTLFEREVTVPSDSIEIRLPKRRDLVVRLRAAEDGTPIGPPGYLYYHGPGFSSGRPLEADDGRVSLGSVVPGEYELFADVRGRAVVQKILEVPAGDGPFEVAYDVPKGFTLTGRVTDLGGRPIAGARVRADGGLYDKRESTTDGDGRYALEGLNDRRVTLGSCYALSASANGRATEVNRECFSRVSLMERTLDFALGEGGTVRGTLRTKEGAPAAGVLVKVVAGGALFIAPGVDMPAAVTDRNGQYELSHVPAGKVRLVVGGSTRSLRVAEGKTVVGDFTVDR